MTDGNVSCSGEVIKNSFIKMYERFNDSQNWAFEILKHYSLFYIYNFLPSKILVSRNKHFVYNVKLTEMETHTQVYTITNSYQLGL